MSKIPHSCCIRSCGNSSTCSFFPVRKEWMEELNKVRPFDDIELGQAICELHFNTNDIVSAPRTASKTLREGVVIPSIFNVAATKATCSNCLAHSDENQKLKADIECLLKELKEAQAEIRCLRENQSMEVGHADQEQMAAPEIFIKMEPVTEIGDELRLEGDLLDIKQDPLDPEQQMYVAYIPSDGSAERAAEQDGNDVENGRNRTFRAPRSFPCSECIEIFDTSLVLEAHERDVHSKQKHICEECGKEFQSKNNLKQHRFVHGEAVYKCTRCSYASRFPSNLRTHERKVHDVLQMGKEKTQPEPFECYICKQNFKQLGVVRLHLAKSHSMDKCIICNEDVAVADTMHCCAGQSQLACEFCSSSFNSMGALITHSSNDHSELKKQSYACDVCRQQFDMRIIMEAHRQTRHVACKKCNKIFDTITELKAHKGAPHTKYKHTCEVCGEEFRFEHTLEQHKFVHKAKCEICDDELLLSDTTHDCLGKRSLPCEYCDRSVESLHKLTTHLTNDHTDAEKLIYICDICRRRFNARILMDAHRDKHARGSFACTKCPEVFDKKLQLFAHMRRAHAEANHLCDECGKGFTEKAHLRSHKSIHVAQLVKCPMCPYTGPPVKVSAHRRRLHFDGEAFTCHICDKKFRNANYLNKHSKIHTRTDADRKFPCTLCSFKAFTNDKLNRHMKLTHTTGPGFPCTHCDKSYKHAGDLNKHLREHLGENIYKCTKCPADFRRPWDLQRHSFEHYGEPSDGSSQATGDSMKMEMN